ncbi:unnamed protein product [Trichobilharzia szidati]|nr:unnamed protein product [Trichobilharzia szidati]
MIESRACHVISTITNVSSLMCLPNYLIQLANPNCCPTSSLWASSHSNSDSLLGNNLENSTYSKILPLHCLCHFYANVKNDVGEVSVYDKLLTLSALRWEHLNSGVLQLLLSYMCVLSRGSCSHLPEIFDKAELNAYLCANQSNCVNNHHHLLSSTIETINCLYTNLIKPACLNFESELFPSTLSSQQTVSSNSKTNKYQWDNFASSIPTISTSTSHKPLIVTAWAKGTGFTTTAPSTILPTLVGDGDSTTANNSQSKMTQSKVEREDQYAIVLCNTLSGFLNTFMNSRSNHDHDHDDDDNDELFGSIVSYFMMKFNLINFIINYLRNDSIVEIVSRISLYRSVFRLIHSIALCPQLHWLLVFVQGDLDNSLIVEFSSKLFNAFQSYWSDTTNASIVSTITDHRDNDDDDDDLNKCLSNIDSSCVIALSKQILSYLSKYIEHLNKLGLSKSVGSNYLSREKATIKTPKTEVIAQPTNKPSSKGLTRQPSIRYRTTVFKKTTGNLTKTPNSLLTGNALSNSEFDDTSKLESLDNHHTMVKTCSLLQLKSGFYDLFDETSEKGDGPLSTVTETDEKDNEEGSVVLNQSVEDRSQTIEPVEVNESNESNNDLTNGSSHCEQFNNNNNELNSKSSNILNNKLSDSIYVNQHLLITLNELKNTFKILKIILMYQQLSVNKEFDHHVNSSEDQSSLSGLSTDGRQTRSSSSSGKPNSQVVSIRSSSTSSTNQDYCLALKSIQFCMIKFLSVSENNTVSLLVPHAYADLCTKHEGLILLNRNIKKSPDGGDTTSTSSAAPSVPASAALSSSELKKPSSLSSSSSQLQITPKIRSLDCLQRLAQEVVTLSTSLPLSENASVFMRCDENHLCLIKAIITGPPDTPYAGGCFEFDIYIPPSYPSQPPLVEFRTTAKNTFRFNPNLYEDGKVCLSILNTWHGSAEERWNPETSSLLQVLVSIQSLIFVHEPYFNEPGFECTMGTPKGIAISYKYNARIRAATVRWAMINQLKHLPVGFEEVILKHFLHRRSFIISQVEQWILEMHNHEQFKGIEVYVKELEVDGDNVWIYCF